jgi:two-component sensor histidine kinase
LKHAFPDGRQGQIRIELRKNGDQAATLLVADNGVGLPEEYSSLTNRPLGLRLVRIMARALGASVEVRSHSGTEVRLIFPKAKQR